MDDKIKKYFQTGKWNFRKEQLDENIELTERYFVAHIKAFKYDKDLYNKLINGYLSQKQSFFFIEKHLTSFLFELNKEEFIRLIKFYKLFEAVFFQDLVSPIKDKISEFLSELEIINKENKETEYLKNEIEIELYDFDFFQLLFNLSVWNDYKYYFHNQPNSPIDPYNIQAISFVIQIFQKIIKNKNVDDIEPKKIQERFYTYLNYYADNYKKWLGFEALMSKAIDIARWKDLIDGYTYQNARLITVDEKDFSFIPASPEEEIIWKKNDEAQLCIERFYNNESKNYIPLKQRINPFVKQLNYSHNIEFYFNGIPNEIPFNNETLNPYHILLFMEGLSSFHSERYYDQVFEVIQENPTDNIFRIILKAIESQNIWHKPLMGALNITDLEYFINRIKGKIRFDIEIDNKQIEKAFDFLSYDLEKEEKEFFNILEQPFLKFKDKYYYFTTSVVANNLAYSIENRLLKYEQNIEYKENISKNFEKIIARIFQKNGFNTKVGVDLYKKKKNKKTDIDVLVWKDNEMLIVQAKKTYRRLTASTIEQYNPQLQKGADQIEVSIDFINSNKDKFLLDNNINIKPDELKIYGLVVSNTVEGNFKTYGNNFLKITAAELAIILEDKKNQIVDWQLEAFSLFLNSKEKAIERFRKTSPLTIRAAQIIKQDELKVKYNQLSYWGSKDKTISHLLKAIKGDYLWFDTLNNEIDLPPENASKDILKALHYFGQGKYTFELGDYTKALTIFEKAFKLNPKDKDIKMYYADCLAELGSKNKAIELYSEVIIDFPNYWFAYSNRAVTYQELQEWEKAYNDYVKSLELNPNNIQAFFIILDFHSELKYELPTLPNVEEIIRNVQETDDERIKNGLMMFLYKDISLLENKRKNHELSFDEFILLIEKYMEFCQSHNDFSKPLEIINVALTKHIANPQLLSYKAWIYKSQNNIQEAVSLCNSALLQNDKESELWRILAELNIEQKDIEKAKLNVEKAIELDENNHYAYYVLSQIYLIKNQLTEAINKLKKSLKTERTDWLIVFNKALYQTYLQDNDFDNAALYLRNAIELGDYNLVQEWEVLNLRKMKLDNDFNEIYYY